MKKLSKNEGRFVDSAVQAIINGMLQKNQIQLNATSVKAATASAYDVALAMLEARKDVVEIEDSDWSIFYSPVEQDCSCTCKKEEKVEEKIEEKVEAELEKEKQEMALDPDDAPLNVNRPKKDPSKPTKKRGRKPKKSKLDEPKQEPTELAYKIKPLLEMD